MSFKDDDGKMSFEDDEPIVASQDVSGVKPQAFQAGKLKVSIFCNLTAPLAKSKFKVMLELTGAGSGNDRSGLDLVTVLDVSDSMKGEKLEKMKIAMLFMIKKLSPIDRLSIVKFNESSKRLCPLRQITENSQAVIENLVNGLVAGGRTNISAGLQKGLEVLKKRRHTSGRVGAIMLMSDGEQNEGDDAAKVPVGNVPVHTFGFGVDRVDRADHYLTVLKAIADNSMGGTFSDVQNQDNLSIAFSQCLAGLLTVVVQDLTLTIRKGNSTIVDVRAGNYKQLKNVADDSVTVLFVTVLFGDLYIKEVRKVIVDLLLDDADSPVDGDALKFTYTYRTGGTLFDANSRTVLVRRTGRKSVEQKVEEVEEVEIEEKRLSTAKVIQDARVEADNNNLDGAYAKLAEAQNSLYNVIYDDPNRPNRLIEMLKSEVEQMKNLLSDEEIYQRQGRPFALSSETSHDRQRFAARGDDVEALRLFATPRMDAYLQQAKSFVNDPSKRPPSVDEDVEQELSADPLARIAPILGALSYYMQPIIESLKSIDNILNKASRA